MQQSSEFALSRLIGGYAHLFGPTIQFSFLVRKTGYRQRLIAILNKVHSGSILRSFLQFFFEHLYTTLAWAYDFVAFTSSIGQWSAWQHVAIDGLPKGSKLELGFGTGHLLLALSKKGHAIVGIDSSKQMVKIARHRLRQHKEPARLLQAQAQHLPLRDKTFQSVLSTFPSNYIFERSTLAEIYRVIKPGGVLVIVPGVENITGPKDKRISLTWLADKLSSLLYRLTGQRNKSDKEWQRKVTTLFTDIGFNVEFELVSLPRADVMKITGTKGIIHD